jgi:ABC-type sugar transport system permease subunit
LSDKEGQMKKRKDYLGYRMAAPAVLLIACVSILPLISGVVLSFQNYYLLKPNKPRGFNGIDNYMKLFQDTEFQSVILYTFIYAFSIVIIAYLFGLVLAQLLNREIRFRSIYRALVLLPWVISPTVASTNWLWVLNDRIGFINNVLRDWNIISSPILFLAVPKLARVTVIFTSAWKAFPFMAITILSGLQSINMDLYESAYIDGAGYWKSFFYITLPSIKNISIVSTILTFIWNFNNFENIYLLTKGGPSDATYTLSILTYYTAFYRSNLGYASTIGTSMLVVLLILSQIYMKALRPSKKELMV